MKEYVVVNTISVEVQTFIQAESLEEANHIAGEVTYSMTHFGEIEHYPVRGYEDRTTKDFYFNDESFQVSRPSMIDKETNPLRRK